MIEKKDIVSVGRIGRTHGLDGELQCSVTSDFTDLFDNEATEPEYVVLEMDEIPVPFFLEEYRFRSDESVLLTLEGMDSEEKARRLVGKTIYLLRSTLPERSADELTLEDLVGYRVVDVTTGQDLGEIEDIDDSTMNVLFCLENDVLLPAADELLEEIDTEKRIVRMRVPEGII